MPLPGNELETSEVEHWARALEQLLETDRPGLGRWTVTAIQDATGVSRATLHAILAGDRKHIGRQTLRRLAKLPVAGVAEVAPALPGRAPGSRSAVSEAGVPYGGRPHAPLMPGRQVAGRITDALDERSAADLRLLLRGAMMGGAPHERLLELLDALERAIQREAAKPGVD